MPATRRDTACLVSYRAVHRTLTAARISATATRTSAFDVKPSSHVGPTRHCASTGSSASMECSAPGLELCLMQTLRLIRLFRYAERAQHLLLSVVT